MFGYLTFEKDGTDVSIISYLQLHLHIAIVLQHLNIEGEKIKNFSIDTGES